MAEPTPILKKRAENEVMKEVKTAATKGCDAYVRALAECVEGRLFSVAWACQDKNQELRKCMSLIVRNQELKDELTRQYVAPQFTGNRASFVASEKSDLDSGLYFFSTGF
jgi:COX assembly mitochondrial protein 1